MKPKKLNRVEKTMIYSIKYMNRLRDAGFLDGGGLEIVNEKETEKALKGFEPTQEELDAVIQYWIEEGYIRIN